MAAKKKSGFLSSNALKIIAMVTMVIDHANVIFIGTQANLWRNIGRISFPIFAFLIAEGAVRTKNKLKYAVRLLIFAFISEVPYDIVFNGAWLEFKKQNVFFTLFLGLVSVYVLDFLRARRLGVLGIVTTFALGFAATYISSNYAFMGVVVITLMYIFNGVKTEARYIGFALSGLLTCFVYKIPFDFGFLASQAYAALCFIPLACYNGRRGRKLNKYFFYLFYPAHMLILYAIKLLIA